MKVKSEFILLLIACLSINNANAQYYKSKTGFASTINAYSYTSPAADFIDTVGNMTYKQIGGGVILPVYGKMIVKEKGAHPQLFQLFLNSGFTVGYPEINFKYTLRPRTLYNALAGLTGLYYFGKNNTLLGGAYGFLWEDQITINDPEARFGGFLLYNHLIKDLDLSYKIGAFYSYIFGKGMPLPIVGITKDISEKSRLNLIFPLVLSYSYLFNDNHQYTLFIKPRGFINNFSNEQQDIQFNNGNIPIIQVRRTQIRAGIEEKLKLHQNILLKAEIGIVAYRNLSFFYWTSNTNNSLFETDIKPGGYLQLQLSWKIAKKKKAIADNLLQKEAHPRFIDFSDFDLDDLDLNDLHFEELDFESIDFDDIDLDDLDIDDIIEEME